MFYIQVTHFRPTYIKGDLDSEVVCIDHKHFAKKSDAVAWVNYETRGKGSIMGNMKTVKYPIIVKCYTSKKWVEENTGEERQECFTYKITKG